MKENILKALKGQLPPIENIFSLIPYSYAFCNTCLSKNISNYVLVINLSCVDPSGWTLLIPVDI